MLFCDGYVESAFGRIVDLFFARFDAPYAPRRNDLHFGRERFYSQLETHLIVAFARAAVTYCVRFFAPRYLYEPFCYHGTRERRAEQILSFVHRARFYGGEYAVAHKLVAKILDVDCRRAAFEEFGLPRNDHSKISCGVPPL